MKRDGKRIWRDTQMRRCDKCGCLCDPGDLVNGICDDCREEEQKKEDGAEQFRQLMYGNVKQVELRDFEM